MRLPWLRFVCLPSVCLPLVAACTVTDTGTEPELSEARPALSFADRTAACTADPRVVAGAVAAPGRRRARALTPRR